jgi:hypothetical protein
VLTAIAAIAALSAEAKSASGSARTNLDYNGS